MMTSFRRLRNFLNSFYNSPFSLSYIFIFFSKWVYKWEDLNKGKVDVLDVLDGILLKLLDADLEQVEFLEDQEFLEEVEEKLEDVARLDLEELVVEETEVEELEAGRAAWK